MQSRPLEISSTEHAVILAAGRGSRLEPEEGHKLLVEVDGEPMLARHLRNFAHLGVGDVTVVTGYRHAPLDREIRRWEPPAGIDLHVAVNPAFDGGNGISVLTGVDQSRRNDAIAAPVPFWLTMADHLFDESLFRNLADRLETESDGAEVPGAMLAVDRKIDAIYDLDDATKIRTDGEGELQAIGKELEEFDRIDAGLFWCGGEFVDALDGERGERGNCSTSDAVRALAEAGRFRFFDIGEARWHDIDTPGAREYAERHAS